MKLQEINWPVFRLGEREPQQLDGVVFYYTEYHDLDLEAAVGNLRVVDDRNVAQPTLGRRRLHLKLDPKTKLFPVRTAIYFLADLLKLAKSTTWFIDNHGTVFQHKKHTRAKLTTRKINKVLPVPTLGCVLELEGYVQRFKCIQRPRPEQQYAVVLTWGLTTILYGLSEVPLKPTWRQV